MTATCKEQIEMEEHGESLSDIVSTEDQINKEFGSGITAILDGCPFTVWTTNRVFFPAYKDYRMTQNNQTKNRWQKLLEDKNEFREDSY